MTIAPLARPTSHHNWRLSAVCAQADPEQWTVDAGNYSADAINICGSCPVRIPCRDAHLAVRSVGVVGGGWVFFTGTSAQPRPYPGDDPQLANNRPTGVRKAIDPAVGANFINAGRAFLADSSDYEGLTQRFNLSLNSLRQAASIVRYAPRATVEAVACGEMSISDAIAELRISGAARQTAGGR